MSRSDFYAAVLADSISPDGVRLVTLEVTFPRFILAEVNTHRMLSRNSASSRAIPTEKLIQRVQREPFIPLTFNKRVKGMGVGMALSEADAEAARKAWLFARDRAVQAAQVLLGLECDKSRANRLLEPFMWHTAIISATEWDNFFALRDNAAAQLEFQRTAQLMREAMEASEPAQRYFDEWHLPLVEAVELGEHDCPTLKKLSASRCARVSYDRQHDDESIETTIERAERLMASGHLSPFEHVARPATPADALMDVPWKPQREAPPADLFIGNFRGFVQMRKEIPHEDNAALLAAPAAT